MAKRRKYLDSPFASAILDARYEDLVTAHDCPKAKLNAAECLAVEACLHKDLRQLGYELRFASSAYRPLLNTVGRLLYAGAPLLGRTSRYLKRHNLLAKTAYF